MSTQVEKCRQMLEKDGQKVVEITCVKMKTKGADKRCRQKVDKKVDTIIGHKNSKNYKNGQKLDKRYTQVGLST